MQQTICNIKDESLQANKSYFPKCIFVVLYLEVTRCQVGMSQSHLELVEHVTGTVPSVYMSLPSSSVVKCSVVICITLCFKVSVYNLWPLPCSSDSAGVSICCVYISLLWINMGKWIVFPLLASFRLSHATLQCTIIKQSSPSLNTSKIPA